MALRVRPVPMPGNNAEAGDKSGLWRVKIYNDQTGTSQYEGNNLTYEEAFRLAGELDRKLKE